MKRHLKTNGVSWEQKALLYGKSRSRGLIESATEMVWELDARGRYSFTSPNAPSVLGYSPEELLGRSPFDLMPAGEAERARRSFETLAAERRPFSMVLRRILRKDGRLADIESSGRPVFSGAGQFMGYRGVDRDLTQRRLAGELFQEESSLFAKAIEQAPSACLLADPEGRIVRANAAFCRMLGAAEARWAGRDAAALGLPEAGRRGWWETAAGRFWVGVSRSPFGDGGFELVTVEDRSELKKAETDLSQARKMEALGREAGEVAHDFNNLLTAILGCSESLLRQLGGQGADAWELQEIRKAALRGAALTGRILDFSRRSQARPRPLQINEAVSDMEALLRRLGGDSVELSLRLDAELGLVTADPEQLERVIMNLAVNARDAMPEGGSLVVRTQNVEIEAARCEDDPKPGAYVLISVVDSGSGMDEATRGKIFEPFFTTKAPGRGTGLGLAMAREIIEEAGGSIQVRSRLGEGSTFRIFLPRLEAAR